MTDTIVSVEFVHIATGRSVKFTDFGLSDYSDNLETGWNSIDVYGRMDPIMTYQGTKRTIDFSLTWSGNSTSDVQQSVMMLMMMQYPTYAKHANALAIQSPPLVRVSFGNLIGVDSERGLLCAMNGASFTPGVGFTPQDSPMVRYGENKGGTDITAKNLTLKVGLTVLHEMSLGWHFVPDREVGEEYGFMVEPLTQFGPNKIPKDEGWSISEAEYVKIAAAEAGIEPPAGESMNDGPVEIIETRNGGEDE